MGIACKGPQKHIITPSTYVEDLKDSSVFCRNPGGLGERPWCYTTDPQTRWEHCNIPKCGNCRCVSQCVHAMSLCQDQCSLLSVVKLCLGESLTGQLVSAVPGASLQCSESRKSNPGCFPLPQWDQFGAMPAESKGPGQLWCGEEGEVMVAVKKTLGEETSEVLENFVSEAKSLFSFEHINIVKIHAVCLRETLLAHTPPLQHHKASCPSRARRPYSNG
eukprot:Em0006g1436a